MKDEDKTDQKRTDKDAEKESEAIKVGLNFFHFNTEQTQCYGTVRQCNLIPPHNTKANSTDEALKAV